MVIPKKAIGILSALILICSLSVPCEAAGKRFHRRTAVAAARVTSRPVKKGPPTAVEQAVVSWLARPEIKHSRVGVEIMDLANGAVLFEHDGSKRHTPASTAKVITTSCLYDLLGGDFVFNTSLLTNGQIKEGVLDGDICLSTSQDPSFTRSDLVKLVQETKNNQAEKLRLIKGKLFVLAPADGKDNFQINWLVEDFGQDWMPASSNFVIDRNIAYLSGFPKSLKVNDVRRSNLSIIDNLLSSGIASCFVSLDPASNVLSLYHGVSIGPNGKPDEKIRRDGPYVVANPEAFNIALLLSSLSEQSIEFTGKIVEAEHVTGIFAKEPRLILAEHKSKPLSQLIKWCLFDSDNLYAQQFLRTIAATAEKPPKHPSNWQLTLEERGLNHIAEWLSGIGVPNKEVVLFDGCGLSRKNGVTPHALNLVLRHMSIKNPSYLDLLRVQDSSGKGRFRFKTGAMDTVRGITGILTTYSGANLAVTVLVNGHTPAVKDIRIVIADLIERLKNTSTAAPKLENQDTKSKSQTLKSDPQALNSESGGQ